MLVLSVASWVVISRLWIIILIPSSFILMKKTSSEQYCFIFPNIYLNGDKFGSGFPPTCGQIPPTSFSSEWTKRDPHSGYRAPSNGHLCVSYQEKS